MSDLQALLGGTGTEQQDQGEQGQGKKKQKPTPKPERVKAREKATGTEAVWDEKDNGGRGGWVIPGLSQKMGGPAKGTKPGEEGGPYSKAQTDQMDKAAPTLDNAQADFLRGAHQEAMDKLDALVKANPKMKDDPKYKKLRKHVEIELE